MDIIFPAKNLDKDLIEKYLLEDNFEVRFSLKQKLYYNFLRPILPIPLRQKIQEKYNSRIIYNENFIDDEFMQVVLNANEGKEFNPFPEPCTTVVILTHDVEEEAGFNFIPKVIELEESLGFKSSWNIVPYKYKIDQGIINLINENKHEIGIHGFNHDGKLYYSEKIFNERVPFINEAIKEYGAVGFRSPMVHRNLEWLQKLDIDYDASCFDYDPFQPFPGGTGSIWPFIAGKFVELPYTLPQDHTLFYVLKQKDINIWINKINWLKKNNGMILVLTHPDYLITSHHLHMYKELLKYLKDLKGVWFCLPKEMTDWWKKSSSVPNN
jgi:peptidoglycan/xylan/chitin deacetylase (PgdA/CDA1 family)